MGKANPQQTVFLGGEVSPFFKGQTDNPRYKTALDLCENYLPLLQGPITRRPATSFSAEVRDSTQEGIRMMRFKFSNTQAYILEFGVNYVRFYRDYGQILKASSSISVTGITAANPPVVTTSGAHTFVANSATDEVVFQGATGAIAPFILNRNFKVKNNTGTTFELYEMDGVTPVDGTGWTVTGSAGNVLAVYTLVDVLLPGVADLPGLNIAQKGDTLYMVTGTLPVAKLIRVADDNWTFTSTVAFLDGPYLDQDKSGKTLTPSSATGATNITASGAVFVSTDVGRLIRVIVGSTISWLKITGFTDSTHVAAAIQASASIGTSAISTWQLGAWSATTGYPSAVTFHEDRLGFGGARFDPARFDLSVSGDYENFAASAIDGTVSDDNAISRTLNADDIDDVYWMKSAERGLLIGCLGGAWTVTPSIQGTALTPTNINAQRASTYGSSPIQPVLIGKSILFVQATKRTVRELSYYFEEDGYKAPDRTVLSDHISGPEGFATLAYQSDKPSIIWFRRADGGVAGMTYEREDDALIVAWHRHIYGGASNPRGDAPVVEDLNTIPSPDATREDLWLLVKRYVNGRIVRYIEFQTKIFEHDDLQRDAKFLDCGLSFDNPVDITAISLANPMVVTCAGVGVNGDKILITDVGGTSALDDNTYIIRNLSGATFNLEDMHGDLVDGTDPKFTEFLGGGEIRKFISGVSGLWHLEGETISIYADGASQPDQMVVNGQITFETPAATVTVGYPYNSRGRRLRDEAGAASGSALGKVRRSNRVSFLLYRTLGLTFGTNDDFDAQEFIFRTDEAESRATALFSGIKTETLMADYDYDNLLCWQQSGPFPGTILAAGPQIETQERG